MIEVGLLFIITADIFNSYIVLRMTLTKVRKLLLALCNIQENIPWSTKFMTG